MLNVPGAMYRSAWHDGHTLELISDEIENITGYPPAQFIASRRRNLMSLVHPDDRDDLLAQIAECMETRHPFAVEYRILRADGEMRWVLDRGQLVDGSQRPAVDGRRDVRHHRAPRGRGGAAPARDRRGPCGGAENRGAAGSSTPPTRRGARSSATCTTARSSGW